MIGCSSTVFCSMDFEKVFKMVAEEFHHWEIIGEGEHCLKDNSKRFFKIAPSYEMSYSVHVPMCDVNIASLNERIREDSVLETINNIDFAMEMNATSITFHPGNHPFSMPQLRQKAVEASRKSLRTLDRIAEEYGAPLALENMPSMDFMLGRTVKEFGELIDDTNLRMCFDIGHANTMGEIDGFIKKYKDRFVNIHIHDNHGKTDEHLTCGAGEIDFPKVLKKLKSYSGTYIIESRGFESAVESKVFLEKLF